ncbi:KamA family radical SAM protein [Prolixibacter denitrificans]|uniref:L-lysine 2,3-aminomutase n=2 Tax=Prolixibacter denitrificans TaxID=1541063 RepID=A0A2P8CG54_9BACT|nr:KamA family radical SAM protein [Prolixibacter denitrificans]PSK83970.1 lysine 2,3-aminomutase [Prolixibacter denitrificans]
MKSEMTTARSTASGENTQVDSPDAPVPLVVAGQHPDQLERMSIVPNFPYDESVTRFINQFYPTATIRDWNNWIWQLKNSIHTTQQLTDILGKTEGELISSLPENHLPFQITPYFASLLSRLPGRHPLYRTVIPTKEELIVSPGEVADPLNETGDSPTRLIVHRYPDRVLFLVTGFCSAYCRYCTRSHMVGKQHKSHASTREWDMGIEYIAQNKQIRDVLISGGDPLTLPDFRLEYLLSKLRAIPHVEIIRIGTKVPVVLPMRVTNSLTRMLKKYHPLMMSVHFAHPDELSVETQEACNRLADAGIPLGSQTVLLKGINDEVETFKKLNQGLLKVRVRPYYIYQCDPIPGSLHFRTPVSKGLEIIQGLRGYTSGYAVPHFVIDAPGGGGKIPLLPNYLQSIENGEVILKNYEGNTYTYPDIA